MANMRSQFQRTMFPGIKDFIMSGFVREQEPVYTRIFNVMSTNNAFDEDFGAAGVGLFVRTPEGVEAAEDQFSPGFPKRYQADKFTQSIGMTDEFIEDGKVNIWSERGPDMGYSARQTLEELHADWISGGFTTSTGPDGVALFSASHPNYRPGAGTQSNILNPVGTLTLANLRTALTQGHLFFDDTGVRRLDVEWSTLLVHYTNWYDALELLKSTDRPDTANRATNVISNAVQVVPWSHLTNAKHWFLLANKGDHKLKSYDRKKFNVITFEDKKAGLQWVQAEFRNARGHSHWRGTLGSNPS